MAAFVVYSSGIVPEDHEMPTPDPLAEDREVPDIAERHPFLALVLCVALFAAAFAPLFGGW